MATESTGKTTSSNCQGKILHISFSPPSDNLQYVNLDALSAEMTRDTAILATRVSPGIYMTKRIRSAKHRQR